MKYKKISRREVGCGMHLTGPMTKIFGVLLLYNKHCTRVANMFCWPGYLIFKPVAAAINKILFQVGVHLVDQSYKMKRI
jgi:hypothetical protein